MENLEQILTKHPFLAGMDAKYIKLLVSCASNVTFNDGDYLCREGKPADSFFIIRHGRISIETFIPQGGSAVIQSIEEGNILGWSWLVPPYRWHFDARAIGLTRAIALDGKCLREKCAEDHDLGYEIMKRFALIIAERLESTRLQLLDFYGNSSKK